MSQVEPGRDVNVVLQGTGSVKPGPRARDRYYHSVRTATSWFTLVFLQPGPETEVLREHVLPLLETDPFVLPNTLIAGADFAPPNDENRAKIFGGGHTAGMLGADAHPR